MFGGTSPNGLFQDSQTFRYWCDVATAQTTGIFCNLNSHKDLNKICTFF